MAYVERVQTVIVDETTGAVVAQGAITSPVTVTGVPAVGEVLTAVIAA